MGGAVNDTERTNVMSEMKTWVHTPDGMIRDDCYGCDTYILERDMDQEIEQHYICNEDHKYDLSVANTRTALCLFALVVSYISWVIV